MARPSKRKQKAQRQELARWLEEGWLALVDGDFPQAIDHFRRVVKRYPNSTEGWLGLGLALAWNGDKEEGYQAIRRSVELDPTRVEAWHAMASVADMLGYSLEAWDSIRTARRLAEEQNSPPETRRGLEVTEAAIYQGLQRLAKEMGVDLFSEEGRTLLREVYEAFNDGVRALRERDNARAVASFQRVVELAPNNPRAWGNLGVALAFLGKYDEAEAALQKALDIDPTYEPARLNLAHLRNAREQGDLDRHAFLLEYTDTKRNAPRRKELR